MNKIQPTSVFFRTSSCLGSDFLTLCLNFNAPAYDLPNHRIAFLRRSGAEAPCKPVEKCDLFRIINSIGVPFKPFGGLLSGLLSTACGYPYPQVSVSLEFHCVK